MTATADQPEYHLVIRRRYRRRPLAPYRFAVSVIVSLVVMFGAPGAVAGSLTDATLVRGLAAAVLAWAVLGALDRVLARTGPPGPADTL